MKVEVLEPHGFCMGVRAAVEKASRTLSLSSGKVVYCLHELVHNEQVVADLKARGMRFVESLDDVPDGATVLFSAHGVAPAVRAEARRRGLAVVDATCPFVARAHRAVRNFAARGMPVVVVGRAEHAEVRGVMGECADARVVSTPEEVPALSFPDGPVGVVCQTTLSHDTVCAGLDALRARYPRLDTPAAATACLCSGVRAVRTRIASWRSPARRARCLRPGRGRSRRYAHSISGACVASASRPVPPRLRMFFKAS